MKYIQYVLLYSFQNDSLLQSHLKNNIAQYIPVQRRRSHVACDLRGFKWQLRHTWQASLRKINISEGRVFFSKGILNLIKVNSREICCKKKVMCNVSTVHAHSKWNGKTCKERIWFPHKLLLHMTEVIINEKPVLNCLLRRNYLVRRGERKWIPVKWRINLLLLLLRLRKSMLKNMLLSYQGRMYVLVILWRKNAATSLIRIWELMICK